MTMTTKTITTQSEMTVYIDQVWALLVIAYQFVQGGLHYASKEELIADSARWKVTFSNNEVIAVTLFKAKKGLKLIAMATNRNYSNGKDALKELINSDLPHCWMELSESAEKFVLTQCDGKDYVFNACHAQKLLGKEIEIENGFHYKRNILGFMKSKIIVGTPMLH